MSPYAVRISRVGGMGCGVMWWDVMWCDEMGCDEIVTFQLLVKPRVDKKVGLRNMNANAQWDSKETKQE